MAYLLQTLDKIEFRFEDHFICDEQINGLKSCNQIMLVINKQFINR